MDDELKMLDAFEQVARMENYVLGQCDEFLDSRGRTGYKYESQEANELWLFFRFGYLAGAGNVHPVDR